MLVGAAVVVSAMGCSSGDGDGPAAGATTGSPAPASGDGGSATPAPASSPQLPRGCDGLLPFTDLDRALGRPLFGESRYVQGVAEPSIGRTGRVTCQYGLARNGRGPGPVEVGVSTYRDAESATRRVEATIAAVRGAGATSQSSATVAGQPATVLGDRTSFTAVLALGDRTIAVTVLRSLGGHPDKAVVAVAETVAANWTG